MAAGSSYPSSAFGYWRGGGSDGVPLWQGQGSGMGVKVQGLGIFSQGQGTGGNGGWEPTVLYLLALIVAEMIVFGFIARALR
jgi:hypothetical protein